MAVNILKSQQIPAVTYLPREGFRYGRPSGNSSPDSCHATDSVSLNGFGLGNQGELLNIPKTRRCRAQAEHAFRVNDCSRSGPPIQLESRDQAVRLICAGCNPRSIPAIEYGRDSRVICLIHLIP